MGSSLPLTMKILQASFSLRFKTSTLTKLLNYQHPSQELHLETITIFLTCLMPNFYISFCSYFYTYNHIIEWHSLFVIWKTCSLDNMTINYPSKKEILLFPRKNSESMKKMDWNFQSKGLFVICDIVFKLRFQGEQFPIFVQRKSFFMMNHK